VAFHCRQVPIRASFTQRSVCFDGPTGRYVAGLLMKVSILR
jgi:hypothetical protein